ncbi:MAG: sensor histidine kinase [Sporichthyaceae bacterium]
MLRVEHGAADFYDGHPRPVIAGNGGEGGWWPVMGWSLTRRLRAALGALSVLLLLAGVAIVLVLRQADAALSDQTERFFPARVAAGELLTSLVDQETGLRGFSIAQDQRFLQPYRDGLVDEQVARAQLERLVRAEDPARLALLTLDAAILAWRDQYASLRTEAGEAEGTDTTIEFGRELFEKVRAADAALDHQLADQVQAAQRELDRNRQLVLGVLALMAIAVIGAVVALQRALQIMILRPMRRLGKQVARVSGGEHLTPIHPDGPPDLREMGAGVEAMRTELVHSLAEISHAQRGLEQRAAELTRSNADLEQFAYVASHDLQEPLRKVASFCQLLSERYGGQFDERGEQYLALAVDGAKRMQQLISDLLTFSRVGRTGAGFAAVNLTAAAAQAWDGLASAHEGAELEQLTDPGVHTAFADEPLLAALLANLFGNALKYRSQDRALRVRLTATVEADMLRVSVADNGIGIPPEYAEKVFVIFQRLHAREDFEGTGIGLALAKRIVEFHGGTIGLRESPLGGACVSFTLLVAQNASHV